MGDKTMGDEPHLSATGMSGGSGEKVPVLCADGVSALLDKQGGVGSLVGSLFATDGDDDGDHVLETSWVNQCSVAVSSDASLMALAHENVLVILRADPTTKIFSGDDDSEHSLVVKDVCPPNVTISCIVWVMTEQASRPAVLFTGCTDGHVRVVTQAGNIVLDQPIHDTAITKMQLRTLTLSQSMVTDVSEDLTVLAGNTIARIDGADLHAILKSKAVSGAAPSDSVADVRSFRWRCDGQVSCADAVCCGTIDTSVFGSEPDSSGVCYFRLITTGDDPTMSLYIGGEEERGPSITTKLTSSVVSLASRWFGGGGSSTAAETEEKDKAKGPTDTPQRVRPERYFGDRDRRGRTLSLDPTGRVAAVTDSLGRVLLLDAIDFFVLRIWKGYREAQVAWVSVEAPGGGPLKQPRYAAMVYAPRRGLVEAWGMRHAPRMAAYNVGSRCRLVAAPPPLAPASVSAGAKDASNVMGVVSCFLLHAHGTVERVRVVLDVDDSAAIVTSPMDNSGGVTGGLEQTAKEVTEEATLDDAGDNNNEGEGEAGAIDQETDERNRAMYGDCTGHPVSGDYCQLAAIDMDGLCAAHKKDLEAM